MWHKKVHITKCHCSILFFKCTSARFCSMLSKSDQVLYSLIKNIYIFSCPKSPSVQPKLCKVRYLWDRLAWKQRIRKDDCDKWYKGIIFFDQTWQIYVVLVLQRLLCEGCLEAFSYQQDIKVVGPLLHATLAQFTVANTRREKKSAQLIFFQFYPTQRGKVLLPT